MRRPTWPGTATGGGPRRRASAPSPAPTGPGSCRLSTPATGGESAARAGGPRRGLPARVGNPRWLAALQRHGYKGAFGRAATVDYLFGYDATAGVVEDWMYEQLAASYVFDETNRAFLEQANPWAL